jgi:hypothetical protein
MPVIKHRTINRAIKTEYRNANCYNAPSISTAFIHKVQAATSGRPSIIRPRLSPEYERLKMLAARY